MDPRREPASDVAPARHRREVVELLEEPQLGEGLEHAEVERGAADPAAREGEAQELVLVARLVRSAPGRVPVCWTCWGSSALAAPLRSSRSARRTSSKVKPFAGVVTSRSPRPMRRPPAAAPRSRCPHDAAGRPASCRGSTAGASPSALTWTRTWRSWRTASAGRDSDPGRAYATISRLGASSARRQETLVAAGPGIRPRGRTSCASGSLGAGRRAAPRWKERRALELEPSHRPGARAVPTRTRAARDRRPARPRAARR